MSTFIRWLFQHTAARRRLAASFGDVVSSCGVSTHSRPKAAGACEKGGLSSIFGFNTQPPEGGWVRTPEYRSYHERFNTQPPEGGWMCNINI